MLEPDKPNAQLEFDTLLKEGNLPEALFLARRRGADRCGNPGRHAAVRRCLEHLAALGYYVNNRQAVSYLETLELFRGQVRQHGLERVFPENGAFRAEACDRIRTLVQCGRDALEAGNWEAMKKAWEGLKRETDWDKELWMPRDDLLRALYQVSFERLRFGFGKLLGEPKWKEQVDHVRVDIERAWKTYGVLEENLKARAALFMSEQKDQKRRIERQVEQQKLFRGKILDFNIDFDLAVHNKLCRELEEALENGNLEYAAACGRQTEKNRQELENIFGRLEGHPLKKSADDIRKRLADSLAPWNSTLSLLKNKSKIQSIYVLREEAKLLCETASYEEARAKLHLCLGDLPKDGMARRMIEALDIYIRIQAAFETSRGLRTKQYKEDLRFYRFAGAIGAAKALRAEWENLEQNWNHPAQTFACLRASDGIQLAPYSPAKTSEIRQELDDMERRARKEFFHTFITGKYLLHWLVSRFVSR